MGTTFDSTKLNFKQAYEILRLLSREESLSKEELYENIGGSRQTKIRVVKEMIDHKMIYVSSVEAHNKQLLKITDRGRDYLAMEEGAKDGAYEVVPAASQITFRTCETDDAVLKKIKMNVTSMISLLNENPPNYDILTMVLQDTLSKAESKKTDPDAKPVTTPVVNEGPKNSYSTAQ